MFSQNLLDAQIGEYRIVDHLGAGGMGEVYRAVHARLGRVAAIKVLNQTTNNPTLVERFCNEARIQASLQHPSIVTLYDYCEHNGHPCIVMEFVNGQTLDEVMQMHGILPLQETLRIFKAVVAAVAYIHNHAIVHRDIKANNIKLTLTGAVKLLDFGISQSASTPKFTEVGNVIGTWQYLSPEQIYGGTADARSDIWALGVLLYEMVAGTLPFEAETLGSLTEKIKKAEYLSPSVLNHAVPKEIEALIAKCLRKNPADRYASAAELERDLERLDSSEAKPIARVEHFAARTEQFLENLLPLVQDCQQSLAALLNRTGKLKPVVLGVPLLVLTLLLNPFSGSEHQTTKSSDSAPLKTVRVRLFEGKAQVFRNGQSVGVTPYETQAPVKERLALVLKRAGYQDLPVQILVSDNEAKNEAVYQMHPAESEE